MSDDELDRLRAERVNPCPECGIPAPKHMRLCPESPTPRSWLSEPRYAVGAEGVRSWSPRDSAQGECEACGAYRYIKPFNPPSHALSEPTWICKPCNLSHRIRPDGIADNMQAYWYEFEGAWFTGWKVPVEAKKRCEQGMVVDCMACASARSVFEAVSPVVAAASRLVDLRFSAAATRVEIDAATCDLDRAVLAYRGES